MKIKVKSFGGKLGFKLRKIMPQLGSGLYLNVNRFLANNSGKKYIRKVLQNEIVYPTIVSIETINKCNGTCSFCGCNKNDDKRPFKIMSDELFKKIIKDLKDINFDGLLMIVMNDEPFLDKKIMERLEYASNELPNCKKRLFTNGSIISIEQLQEINDKKLLNELLINNYSKTMKLNDNIQKIYDYFKDKDMNLEITINQRYQNEVLSNRANSSPNKSGRKEIKSICTLPYTDFNVNPYGIATLCCCDATEKTNFGDVNKNSVIEIFNNAMYNDIREKMKNGRNGFGFCKFCDFIDTGMRKKKVIEKLNKSEMIRN